MMKKNLYFGLGALLALASCSNDDIIPDDVNVSDGANRYLSVNIVSTPESGTRAGGNQETGDPDNNATYEEGYANENAVTAVRFYFFDNEGTAVNVKAKSEVNWYQTEPVDANTNNMPNIEKQLQAVVVINIQAGDKLPSQMVAVVNPDETSLGNGSKSLDDLNKEIADYQAIAKNSTDTDGSFVMTNSVYSTSNQPGGTEVYAVQVKESDYRSSQTLAEQYPINIYVERNVAKVRLSLGSVQDNTTGLIQLKSQDGKDILVDNKQVYLKIAAWDVTADTDKGYLKKHIDTKWGNNLLGDEPWNWSAYFRSFWATNPGDVANRYHSYNDIAQKNFSKDAKVYVNENAHYGTTRTDLYPTKVIIKGTLVDANGDPIEVYKYAGLTGIGAENLKKTMLTYLQKEGVLFSKTTSVDGQTNYSEVTEADVEFKTAIDAGEATTGEGTTGRYYVYLQLSTVGEGKVWVNSDTNDESTKEYGEGEVNAYLKDVFDHTQIYKTGMTYYYFAIEHLGSTTDNPIYGVVRNHIYDATIQSIVGLGTPVYKPEEVIYPEKPKEEYSYLGTRINILSWRVVSNDVNLTW